MKLMIFGATGGTGAQLLTQARDAGHDVIVVARRPARVAPGTDHQGLTVIHGDALDSSGWRSAVAGQDAVLSCLGSTDRKHPTTVYSQGAANILDAMRSTGVRRLVCLSSAGLEIPPGTPLPQRLVTRLIVQRIYAHAYTDMAKMERIVAAGDADWTVIRPPMLTDGPLTGTYRTAANAHLDNAKSVSRADLAHYILSEAEGQDTRRAVVEISS